MTEPSACKICHSELSLKFAQQKDINFKSVSGTFDWYECTSCKSLMVLPDATNNELESYYSTDYQPFKITARKDTSKRLNAVTLRVQELKNIYDETSEFSFLDIGCGSGLLIYNIKKHFPNSTVYGLDFAIDYAKINTEGLDNVTLVKGSYSSINSLPKFDVISSSQVMEHLQDPVEFTEFIKSHSTDSTLIFQDIPNIDALSFKLFGKKWIHLDTPRHRVLYSKQGLDVLFNEYSRRYVAFGSTKAFFVSAYHLLRVPRFKFLLLAAEALSRLLDPLFAPDDKILLIAKYD